MKIIRPETVHGIVNRVHNSLFSYQAWPTVAQDENGVLYAVASGFRVCHVDGFGKTVMYISRNGGETWTKPMVINDSYIDDRDVGIVYLGGGKLLVSWFTRSPEEYDIPKYRKMIARAHPAGQRLICSMTEAVTMLPEDYRRLSSYTMLSRDYGVTWEQPVSLPVTAPHGPTLCKDGSLIYLGSQHREPEERTDPARIQLFRSRDEGSSWQMVSEMARPAWLQPGESLCEPHVLELPDGRLLGAVRVEGRKPFTMAMAFSADQGESWSELVCTDVSGAPPHLMRHSSGAIICTFGRREPPYGEYAIISHDNGESWTEEYVIDDNTDSRDLGYGSTVELRDGSLLSVYYQRCPGDDYPSILYTNWKL